MKKTNLGFIDLFVTKKFEVIGSAERRGMGTEDDPVRLIPQLWTLDGKLICEGEDEYINPKKK